MAELQEKASSYFGYDVINYAKTLPEYLQDTEWQLFYAGKIDDEDENEKNHIYLISKGYINSADLPTVIKNGEKVTRQVKIDGETVTQEVRPFTPNSSEGYFAMYAGDTNLFPYYPNGSGEITDTRLRKLNKQYYEWLASNNKTSKKNNMKAVAYMLDTTTWKDFTGANAEYSIGAPSIELFLKSFNKYRNQGQLFQTKADNIEGYSISIDNGQTYNQMCSYLNSEDPLPQNNPYNINKNYWLASPALRARGDYVEKIYGDGTIGVGGHARSAFGDWAYCAFRPIVCLNAGVSLEKIKDKNGIEVFKIVE